jgi:glycosyltransferase involved in cell wall biosynthesis
VRIAFYYHIPISNIKSKLYLPGHFGVFIDELASNVDELIIIMHSAKTTEHKFNDYELKARNIQFIDLGITTPAWHRAIFHRKFLHKYKNVLNSCDAVLVRTPCALAPFFHKYILNTNKLWFMVVGDYEEGAKHWPIKSVRDLAIKYYLRLNNYFFEKKIKHYNLLVNSSALYKKYKSNSKFLFQIRTTTLSSNDFYLKPNEPINKSKIKLLYVGRIDETKGLFELVEAIAQLNKCNIEASVKIVGWELNTDNILTNKLKAYADSLGINEKIVFTGKLNIGEQLNKVYREADLFVLPSYHEGFPRVIWEAMANSLPVITTPVGGIPDILTHKKNSYFIETHSAESIVNAVISLVNHPEVVVSMVNCSMDLVKENTLESQTQKLVNYIKNGAK